jgi:DNA-binding winged helix-turn-helix (wHTH) protein
VSNAALHLVVTPVRVPATGPGEDPAPTASVRPARLVFGGFELDLRTQELWRHGTRVPLQPKPFQVLTLLLEHPGEIVTRERLHRALWSGAIEVDFNQGLGYCISHLRRALGDDARHPRFIATLPRRGFRFVATVTQPELPARSTPAPSAIAVVPPPRAGLGARVTGLFRRLARWAGRTRPRADMPAGCRP